MVAQCNHVFQANVVAFYVVPIILINKEIAVTINKMATVIFSRLEKFEKEAFINQWVNRKSIFPRNVFLWLPFVLIKCYLKLIIQMVHECEHMGVEQKSLQN